MNHDQLENNLRAKFSRHSEEIDLQESWSHLENRRRKKRRNILFFWFAPMLILSSVLTSLWFCRQLSNEKVILDHSLLNSSKSEVEIHPENENYENLENIILPKQKVIGKNESIGINKYDDTFEEQSIISPISKKEINGNNRITKEIIKSDSDSRNENENLKSKTIGDEYLKTMKRYFARLDFLIRKETNLCITTSKANENSMSLEEIVKYVPALSYNEMEEKLKVKFLRHTIGAGIGYGLSSRKLSSISNSSSELVDSRNKYETAYDKAFLNFSYQFFVTPKLFLESGLQLELWSDKLVGEINISQNVQKVNVISVNEYRDGRLEKVYGLVTYDEKVSKTINAWNYQMKLDIPVKIGYRLSISDKLDLSVTAGIHLGVYNDYNGHYVIQNDSSYRIENVDGLDYRSTGLLSGVIGVDGIYHISPQWSISLGLVGETDLNNRSKKISGMTDKYRSLAFRIGGYRKF